MPNIKSAIKRVEVTERNRQRNVQYKSTIKTLVKKSLSAVEAYGQNNTPETLAQVNTAIAEAYSKIDKAAGHGVLHKNTASRKKARLAAALQRATKEA